MKKTIRLTESDLIKIINKIIIEQDDQSSQYATTDKYQERIKDTGKTFKFQQVSQEMLPKYLQWYQGSTYPEIQEYISKTYQIPRLFDPKSLEITDKTNKAYNVFTQFLLAVKYSLIAAAKDNYNGYLFSQKYDLNKVTGNGLDPNWISVLSAGLPIIGEKSAFQKFVGKVITSRRKAIGLNN
jgi:hypothetical protein